MSFSLTSSNRDNKDNNFIYFQFIVYTHPKWVELDFFFFFKLYLLKLMKMAYGSLSMSETRHFNLILNIAIAYNYE